MIIMITVIVTGARTPKNLRAADTRCPSNNTLHTFRKCQQWKPVIPGFPVGKRPNFPRGNAANSRQ